MLKISGLIFAIDETNTIGTEKMNRITRDEYIEIFKGFMQPKFNDREAQLNFALGVVERET